MQLCLLRVARSQRCSDDMGCAGVPIHFRIPIRELHSRTDVRLDGRDQWCISDREFREVHNHAVFQRADDQDRRIEQRTDGDIAAVGFARNCRDADVRRERNILGVGRLRRARI